jgi:SAM-dependent methyltransferase
MPPAVDDGSAPAYDSIGVGYARHRRPDPRIERAIHEALGPARSIVNVGAGAGSYEPVDRFVLAIEPSLEMIRQRPPGAAPCLQGTAESLGFQDRVFDAALALLTVHHWSNPRVGVAELARVARGVVVFTFDPAVHNSFWLFQDYVPAMTRLSSTAGVLPVDDIARIVEADRIEEVLIPHDCVDGFGWAYWRRPEAYLLEDVRRCISGFGLAPAADVERGMAQLRRDLDSGRWHDRYGHLLDLDAVDGGFRLVIREMR